MLGSFSNGGIGMGIAFTLEDHFSKSADTINKKMDKLSGTTDKIAQKMNQSMNKIHTGMKMLAVGAVISAPFVKGLAAASDLEENINKVDVAFGNYAGTVKKFADTTIDKFGIDKIKALEMSGLFGDMATGIGMSQDAASDMSQQMTALVGDIASFKNISHDEAMEKLTSVFDGQGRKLLSLGIVMNNVTLEAFALDKGLKKFADMSQVEKSQLRFQFIMDRSKNAVGDYLRTAEGFANSKRTMQGMLTQVSATMGGILMPTVSKMFQGVSKLLKAFDRFANTEAGKTIMGIVAAMGAFLAVGGLVMILSGGIRIVVIKMAGSFNSATRAQILHTIATKGTIAGLKAMGRATWAAIGPFAIIIGAIMFFVIIGRKMSNMLINGSSSMKKMATVILLLLGPIGWLILAYTHLKNALKIFDDSSDKMLEKYKTKGGLVGWFVRLAGHVRAAAEIWKSWNGETFTISEKLKKKLDALGIFDSVVAMGTWLVRLKEMMKGVWTGIKEGFTAVKDVLVSVFNYIYDSFVPVEKQLDGMGISFSKNTSDMEKWRTAGKYIGYAIVGIIVLITVAMVIMAISMLAAMIVPIIIITLIIVIIYYLYQAWIWLKEGVISVWESITGALSDFWDYMVSWWDWFTSIPERAYQWGADFVNGIWEGIKGAWQSMVDWLSEAWDSVKSFFGFGGEDNAVEASINKQVNHTIDKVEAATGGGVKSGVPLSNARTFNVTSKTPDSRNNPRYVKDKPKESNDTYVIQNVMDGEIISERVIERQEFKAARQ